MKAFMDFFRRRFKDPSIYAQIAMLLREGHPIVEVKYRNRCDTRYYTGSGQVCNSGWGLNKRWNVHVEYFNAQGNEKVYHSKPSQYVWVDPEELELVQHHDPLSKVEISVPSVPTNSIDDVVTTLHNFASKLRPGQGYKINNIYITKDLCTEDGYKIHQDNKVYIVPVHLLNLPTIIGASINPEFDTNNVIVVNEKVIKRQHRKPTDIRRWYELKQVPSITDNWVLSFMPCETGHIPVFYYKLDIIIDDPSRAGYPFYVTDILKDAIQQLSTKYVGHDLDINQNNIKVHWDRTETPVYVYYQNSVKYPLLNDTQPIIIIDEIVTKYRNVKARLKVEAVRPHG